MRLLGAVAVAALLAGCADDPAPAPVKAEAPLDFDYLTKLRLNVASVDIDQGVPSFGPGEHVEGLAPLQPAEALRTMARERVLPGGATGRARVTVEEASITRTDERMDGLLGIRLDVATSDGTRSGYAEARVARSRIIGNDDPRTVADRLERQMMADMNVEFEYQVRKSLKDYLQTTAAAAPVGVPVQSQDLPPTVPGS